MHVQVRTSVAGAVRAVCAILVAVAVLHVPHQAAAGAESGLGGVTRSTVTYKTVDGEQLSLLVWKPVDVAAGDRRPAIVFFHGGGWSAGEASLFGPQAEYLAARGMVAISVGYRTRGPVIADEDGVDAWNYVHDHADELGIDPERMVAAGGSAGGQMALATGFLELPNSDPDKRPAAIAIINPVSRTTANYPGGYGRNRFSSDEEARVYSPYEHIEPGRPPVLIMHGTGDRTVSVRNSIDFVTAMRQAGNDATLVTYDRIDHGFYNRQVSRYNRYFYETMSETDRFLQRLGFLSGPQQVRPEPAEALHNGGFEEALSGWTATSGRLSSSEELARIGRSAALLDPEARPEAALSQDVTEAVRKRGQGEYLMRAWVRPVSDADLDVTMTLSLREEGTDEWTDYTLPATTTADDRYVQAVGTAATAWDGTLAEARLQVAVAGADDSLASAVAVDDASLTFLPARVGAWSFARDTGATAVDESGFDLDGTITGTTWRRGGHGGGHLSFADGGSVQVPRPVDPARDFRVTAWVRLDSAAAADQVMLTQRSSTAQPWLYVPAGSTRLATGLGGRPLVGDVGLPLGEWVQVTLTRGDGLLRLYVGDQLAAASPRSTPVSSASWLVGTSWQGVVADIEAFDHADTANGAFAVDPAFGYVVLGTMRADQPMRGGELSHVRVPVTNSTTEPTEVTVSLDVPSGWTTQPATVSLAPGQEAVVEVPVTAPVAPTTATLAATASATGSTLVLADQVLTVVTAPSPAVSALALDAGSATSPVLPGYQRLAPEDAWSPGRSSGWVDATPDTRDRAALDDLRRDFTMSTASTTVRVAVPAGRHDVYLLTGDASYAAGRLVVAEGATTLADTGRSLASGEFEWLGFTLDGGPDGRLADLTLDVVGSGNWRLNALAVVE